MKSITEGNKLPADYGFAFLTEALSGTATDEWVAAGHNTMVRRVLVLEATRVYGYEVKLHQGVIARVFRSAVGIDCGQWETPTTFDRINRCLAPIGWKIDIKLGRTIVCRSDGTDVRAYTPGMAVTGSGIVVSSK